MKQSVGTPVIVAIVVVVVGLIGFFGYRMFLSGPATGGPKPSAARDDSKFRQQYQNYGQQRRMLDGPRGNMGG